MLPSPMVNYGKKWKTEIQKSVFMGHPSQGVPLYQFKPQIAHANYSCISNDIPAFETRIIQTSLEKSWYRFKKWLDTNRPLTIS